MSTRTAKTFTSSIDLQYKISQLLADTRQHHLLPQEPVKEKPRLEPPPLVLPAIDENSLLEEDYKQLYQILGLKPEQYPEKPPKRQAFRSLVNKHTLNNFVVSSIFVKTYNKLSATNLTKYRRIEKRLLRSKKMKATKSDGMNYSRFIDALLTLGIAEFEARIERAKHQTDDSAGSKNGNGGQAKNIASKRTARKAAAA